MRSSIPWRPTELDEYCAAGVHLVRELLILPLEELEVDTVLIPIRGPLVRDQMRTPDYGDVNTVQLNNHSIILGILELDARDRGQYVNADRVDTELHDSFRLHEVSRAESVGGSTERDQRVGNTFSVVWSGSNP